MESINVHHQTMAISSSEGKCVTDNQTSLLTSKDKHFPGSLTQKLRENVLFYPRSEGNKDVTSSKLRSIYTLQQHKSKNRFPGSLSHKYEANLKYRDVDVRQFPHTERQIRSSSEESTSTCRSRDGNHSPRIFARKRKRLTKSKQIEHPEKLSNKWRENLRFLDVIPNATCGGGEYHMSSSESSLHYQNYRNQQVKSRLADDKHRKRLHKNLKRKRKPKPNTLSKKLKANMDYLRIPNDTPVDQSTDNNTTGDGVTKDSDGKHELAYPKSKTNKQETNDSSFTEGKNQRAPQVEVTSKKAQTVKEKLAKKLEKNMRYLNINKGNEDTTKETSIPDGRYPGSLSKKWEKNLCFLDVSAMGTHTNSTEATQIESKPVKNEPPESLANTMEQTEQKYHSREVDGNVTCDGDQLLVQQHTKCKMEDLLQNIDSTSEYTTTAKPSLNSPKKRLDEIICFLHNRKNESHAEITAKNITNK